MKDDKIAGDAPLPPDDSWVQVEDDGFIGMVGPLWTRGDADLVQPVGFRAEPRHRNLNGVVQGGMMMTLADRGMGRIARRAHDGPVATVHFSYDFFASGKIGSFIELRPRIGHQTGGLMFMEAELMADDDLLGRANGVWKKLRAS